MTIVLQILLSTIILVLTGLITFAGIQVFHILKEFRFTLKKLNNILDNTHTLSQASAKPIAAVNEFFAEVQTLVTQTQDDIIESTPDRVITPPRTHASISSLKTNKPAGHFFHRSGTPLRPS